MVGYKFHFWVFTSPTELDILIILLSSDKGIPSCWDRLLLSHSECSPFLFQESYTLYRASYSKIDRHFVFTIRDVPVVSLITADIL